MMKLEQSPVYNLAKVILQQIGIASQGLAATDLEKKIKDDSIAIQFQLLQLLEKNNMIFLVMDHFEKLFRFAIDQQELKER